MLDMTGEPDAPIWDEDASVVGAHKDLYSQVVLTAVHDMFSPKGATKQDRVEAYLFLTAVSGPWAESRNDICSQISLDPDVLRERIVRALAGDIVLPLVDGDVAHGRALHDEMVAFEREAIEKARREAEARKARAALIESLRPPPEVVRIAVEPPPDVEPKPLARIEYLEVNGLPLGHVVRLDEWPAGAYCSILRAQLPPKHTGAGRALLLATSEQGARYVQLSNSTKNFIVQVAALLGLEVLYQDKDGNPVRRNAAWTARLRLPPHTDA